MICKNVQKNLSDYLEKGLSDSRQTRFEKHLKECPNCGAELKTLKMIVMEASSFERVVAPDSLWTRIENELEVTDEPFPTRVSNAVAELRQRLNHLFKFRVPVIQMAGVLAVLVVGVFLGRTFFSTRENVNLGQQTAVQQAELKLISQRTEHYLEKSTILFLGIVNTEFLQEENSDWSTEKRVARNLLKEAAFLKGGLSRTKNERVKQLVEELELILLEIANLEEEQDIENIELVKSGIDRKGLLLKIYLHDLNPEQNLKSAKNIL